MIVAVICILLVLSVAGINSAQNSARNVKCQANLRTIGAAAAAFFTDKGRPHPVTGGLLNEYMGIPYAYGKADNPVNPAWFCPADSRVRESRWSSTAFGSTRVSYGVNQEVTGTDSSQGAFGKTPPVKITRPAQTVHYVDATRYYCGNKPDDRRLEFRHPKDTGLNILYYDGHVSRFDVRTDKDREELYQNTRWKP